VETIIRDKDFKNKTALSPSRIDTFLHCSMIYAAKYKYKLPDPGNDGSKRGSTTHDVLEILDKKRHRDKIDVVLKDKSCKKIPALWKLIKKIATKYGVGDEKNLSQIDGFIYVALKEDFFGPENTIQRFSEKSFDFEVENKYINYRLKGFIDSSFIYKRGDNLYVKITDWKTSKEKFDDKKIKLSHQAICYQLATIRYLYPQYKLETFNFIFLKFANDPIITVDLKDDNFLLGYEYWLTLIQKEINNFSLDNQNDNIGFLKEETKWLCGKDGVKKDGNPNWICSCRKPLEYYALKDKDGNIIKTSFNNDIEGGKKVFYPGCNFFYKDGKKRLRSFE
jgi:hypothetical protein